MGHTDTNFKTGNICRIYIKDFLTLDEVEIRPKPHLNFICGPNGTGKSTILCAICICLGGKPSITGRGKEVYEFVKHGKESSVVEVEVFVEGDEPNVVICRRFDLSKKSVWSLQGQDVAKKVVDAKIASLHIEMDNLCQFLPQDRVANFAKMNSMQLLQATEKAVGDTSLSEEHTLLCSSGERLTILQTRVKDLEDQLNFAVKRNAQLKDAVANHVTKVKLEESIKKLHTQRLWFLYDRKRQLHSQHKEKHVQLQVELKERHKNIEPAQKLLDEKLKTAQNIKNVLRLKSEEIQKKRSKTKDIQKKYEYHDENIRDRLRDLAGRRAEEQQRQRQLGDMNKQLSVLRTQLDNMTQLNEKEVAVKLRQLTLDIQGASQSLARLQGQQDEAMTTKRAAESKVVACERELKAIQDVKWQRMDLLNKRNKDAYNAACWLQDNQDKFNAPVYPPICTLLNLKEPKYAKYVENRISGNDLVSFVCENKEDMNTFKHIMDRQRIRVNIVHSTPTALDSYCPNITLEELRNHGFETYMRECVDAPPAIMSFLCRNYDIHRIPIAQQGDYNAVHSSFNNFYIGDRRYGKNRSRYDAEVATIIQHLREAELLHITVNTQRIHRLKEDIDKSRSCIRDADEVVHEAAKENTRLMQELESWRNEKRVLLARKDERKVLEQRISQKKSQVDRCAASCVDLKAEEEMVNTKVKEQVDSLVRVTEERGAAVGMWVSPLEKHIRAVIKVRIITVDTQRHRQQLSTASQELAALKEQVEATMRELETLKCEAQWSLQKLLKGLGVSNYRHISAEVREQFQSSNLEDTERQLAEEEAHRDCLVTATDKEVEEYKKHEAEMRQLQCWMDDAHVATDAHTNDLENVRQSWLPRITKLIENISQKFSQFMAQLGCAGEVVLSIPEDHNSFKLYGTTIRVSFRDQERLRELTAQHQSGGERAMSTALYLLSLQTLTPVPFRCVDEINQGMDPINERQLLKMLMETEALQDASQYFFVTPKLLPLMEYGECVNLMVVFNSQTMLPHSRLSLKRVLKARRHANKKKSL